MGMYYEAYVAYGLRIPRDPYRCDNTGRTPREQVDQLLSVPTVKDACPDVGHLEAGAYDRNMFFLVTKRVSTCLGEYTRVSAPEDSSGNREREAEWTRQLSHVITLLGWSHPDLETPGWFVVADQS